jgi:nicotinamidase-related amidase
MLIERDKSCVLLIDVQEKLFPLIHESEQLEQNIQWMVDLAKTLRVDVMTTEQYPKGLGHTLEPLKASTRDAALEKIHFSIYADDAIKQAIDTRGEQHYIVVGIESHVCVMQSVLELRAAGKAVFVVADCIGSRSDWQDKKYALKRMRDVGAFIVTREMVLFEWLRQAGTDEFKQVSKQFLQS